MSKAARAIEIYQEEAQLGGESLRKRCIARFKSELAMKDAGAGTYFQNTKKKLEGADGTTPQLTLSPKPQPKTTAKPAAPVLNSVARWSRYDTDENGLVTVVECYMNKEDMEAALAEKGGAVTSEPAVVNVGDCFK